MSVDWRIIVGDCRESLRALPERSVQTCVTSPPYFGLRDYGHDGQIGLEPTPDEFVAALVEVFREVRRVLRDDGTVWLNLGSSYFGAPTTGGCSPKSTLTGGGGKYRTGSKNETMFSASRDSGPNPSPQPKRAPAYGSDGTAPQDSTGPDSACLDLCDGCRDATQSRRDRSGCIDPLPARDAQPPSLTARDSEPPGSGPASLGASPLGAQASTTPRSSEPPPGECSHCANCGACLSVLRSSARDARLCARTAEHTNGSGPLSSEFRTQDTDALGMAWVNYTRRLKPKDMVPTPWMVAMALQADGWYLRSEIIWAKRNCMPESVTDRPTKAHEQIFLLSKRPSYFYDHDAIREESNPEQAAHDQRYAKVYDGPGTDPSNGQPGNVNNGGIHSRAATDGKANKRSVWRVASTPYAGAHFATFPPKLIEPCILAGTPPKCCGECGAPWRRVVERTDAPAAPKRPKDYHATIQTGGVESSRLSISTSEPVPTSRTTGWEPTCTHQDDTGRSVVLDPFAGAGTVGVVCGWHGREFIGCELNPEYAAMARERIALEGRPGGKPNGHEVAAQIDGQLGLLGDAA